MKKVKLILSLYLLLFGFQSVNLIICKSDNLYAQDIPDRPNPPRLVNDYINLLNTDEQNMLENKLVRFNDSSSTQIAIVIVNTLNDLEPADFAQRLGEKWGVGQKGKNNGVVVLLKVTGVKGQNKAFIAPGYGLEPVIPDATCKLIIEKEMKPFFIQNQYYNGLDAATNIIMSLAKKDFPASAYNKKAQKKRDSGAAVVIFLVLIIIFVAFIAKVAKAKSHLLSSGKGNTSFWALFWLMMMANSSSRGGHWNDFNSGSGGFGGGGGGFGGFGGGSFGGGGAGGSW